MLALRKVSVHAYEDPGRPEGGHAIVLLHGIDKAPGQATFRLKPGDGTAITDAAGWPQGDLKPIDCRVTADGLELQIGPDVTECDLLLPGTLVEIEVPGADARGEFLWPNIAPMLRPKRRTVIVNKPKRKGGEAEASDKTGGDAAPTVVAAAAETVTPEPAIAAVAAAVSAAAADALAKGSSAAEAVVDGVKTSGTEVVAESAAASGSEPPSSPAAFHIPGLDDIEALANATLQSPAKATAETPPTTSVARPETTDTPAAPSPAASATADAADTQPTVALRSKPAKPKSAPLADTARDSAPASDEPYYPHARAGGRASGAPSGSVARREGGSRRAANAAQAVAGLLAVVAALWVLSRESSMRTVAPQPQTETATIGVAAQGSERPFAVPAPIAAGGQPQDISLFDVLSVGAISPRGTSAASMGAARALDAANAQLSSANRDTEEAAFWLRRYITSTLGNDRTMRALTQLGSVYAEPEGRTPDYGKARLLWEIASAAGDPVAMCFLGLLHENGLGGPADRKTAQQWYERSKGAGGCPGLDESLARVRQ